MKRYDEPTKEEQEKYLNENDWQKVEGKELEDLILDMTTKATSTKQISLRIKEYDLRKCEARASSQGLKYQSVIKALIHQYANGLIKL